MTTARMTFDQRIDARDAARQRRESKAHDRLVAREEKADAMVGELVRDGRTVHYFYPAGGKYREGNRLDLVQFLVRNNYA
jgi:hypothetical protein